MSGGPEIYLSGEFEQGDVPYNGMFQPIRDTIFVSFINNGSAYINGVLTAKTDILNGYRSKDKVGTPIPGVTYPAYLVTYEFAVIKANSFYNGYSTGPGANPPAFSGALTDTT